MRDSIRTVECIVRNHPELTGKEVLALHEQDKREHEEYLIKRNQEKHDYAKDLNENGGYFRGKFGNSQHYYYRVFNVQILNDGQVMMDVEKIVIFDRAKDPQQSDNTEFSLERQTKFYERADTYGLSFEERIDKEAWDKVNAYINAMTELFWRN